MQLTSWVTFFFIFYFIASLMLFHTSDPDVEFPLTLMLPPVDDPVPVEILPPAIFPRPGTSKDTLSDMFPIAEFIFSLAIEQALL